MIEYLGEELIDILTPNFTTTDDNSLIIFKISIMGTFKHYFDYKMVLEGCGIPYIILEGTVEDYKKIISKLMKLKKYEFDWYINEIIPHIIKMFEAKDGKIDNDYFKSIIQEKSVTEISFVSGGSYGKKVDHVSGWFLNFLPYLNKENHGRLKRFTGDSLKVKDFKKLANQMLTVPFDIEESITGKQYLMKYEVGFIGCEQNEKNEVFPIKGWIVSKRNENDDIY